jgi:hypothetical protein
MWSTGVIACLVAGACAKADEPKAPPPASDSSSAGTPITVDASNVDDAAGAARALPMPQKFPRVVWDAAAASRDAAAP